MELIFEIIGGLFQNHRSSKIFLISVWVLANLAAAFVLSLILNNVSAGVIVGTTFVLLVVEFVVFRIFKRKDQ